MTTFGSRTKSAHPSACDLDSEWILSPYEAYDMDGVNLYDQAPQDHLKSSSSFSSSSSVSSTSSSKLSRDQSPSVQNNSRSILNAAVAELAADLDSPELSFDLQQFISNEIAAAASGGQASTPTTTANSGVQNGSSITALTSVTGQSGNGEDSVSLFTELLESVKRPNPLGYNNGGNNSHLNGVHQQMRQQTDSRYPVKREPDTYYSAFPPSSTGHFATRVGSHGNPQPHQPMGMTHQDLALRYGGNPGLIASRAAVAAAGSHFSSHSSSSSNGVKKGKKHADKGSDEYKKRRERNNVAVRKSREKAKMRTRDTEKRVSELLRDNDALRKKMDMMASQMNVLKTLLISVGVPAESIENEVTRSLHMEGLI